MAGILREVMTLRRVRRVRAWISRARRGNGWIYRDLGVRFHVRSGVMAIRVSILQGHGRTCCLRHASCNSVIILWSVLVLTRQILGRKVG